jgi:hypothetical protein
MLRQMITCRWCGETIEHYYEVFSHVDCTRLDFPGPTQTADEAT